VLALDGGVRGAAAHGEVVAAHHHRAAFHAGAAEHEVGRREVHQLVSLVVSGAAGDLADLVERALVDEARDALANGEAPAIVLPFHPLGAAERLGEGLAATQLVHLRLPVHASRW
jgi:hypothetical protein